MTEVNHEAKYINADGITPRNVRNKRVQTERMILANFFYRVVSVAH